MSIQPRRLGQTHYRCRPFSATQRSRKEPVRALKCRRRDLVLDLIVVYLMSRSRDLDLLQNFLDGRHVAVFINFAPILIFDLAGSADGPFVRFEMRL